MIYASIYLIQHNKHQPIFIYIFSHPSVHWTSVGCDFGEIWCKSRSFSIWWSCRIIFLWWEILGSRFNIIFFFFLVIVVVIFFGRNFEVAVTFYLQHLPQCLNPFIRTIHISYIIITWISTSGCGTKFLYIYR